MEKNKLDPAGSLVASPATPNIGSKVKTVAVTVGIEARKQVRKYKDVVVTASVASAEGLRKLYNDVPPKQRPIAIAVAGGVLALVLRIGSSLGRRKKPKMPRSQRNDRNASASNPGPGFRVGSIDRSRQAALSPDTAQRPGSRQQHAADVAGTLDSAPEGADFGEGTVASSEHDNPLEHVHQALQNYLSFIERGGGPTRARQLLLRLEWLQTMLRSGGISALLRTLSRHGHGNADLYVLYSTLRRASPALRGAHAADALPMQLLGRLNRPHARGLSPGLLALVAEAGAWRDVLTCLRPITASLDAPGEALETVLEGHAEAVTAILLLPDGRLATGCKDGSVRIWRMETCSCDLAVAAHEGAVRGLAFALGRLVSGSGDGLLRLWNVATGACESAVRCHRMVAMVALDSARVVVASSENNTISIVHLASKSFESPLITSHTDTVTSLVLLSGARVASGGLDSTLCIWQPDGANSLEAYASGGKITSIAELQQSRLATAHFDCVRIWSCLGTRCSVLHSISSGKTNRIVAMADGRLVTAHDGKFCFWSTEAGANQGSPLRSVKGRRAAAPELISLPDGRLVTGSQDGAVRVWSNAEQAGSTFAKAACHFDRVSALAALPDGRVASASWDATLRLWNCASGACDAVLKGHSNRVTVLLILSTGHIVSSSMDSTRVWSGRTGLQEALLSGHQRPVTSAAESRTRIVTASEDGTLRVWNAASGATILIFQGHTDRVLACVAVGEEVVVSGSADRTLRVWSAVTGRCLSILRGHSEGVNCLAVLPRGMVVSGSDDKTIAVWSPEEGTCELILKGHREVVRSVVLLGDGRVASVGAKDTLKVWNVEECLCESSGTAFAGTVVPLAGTAPGRSSWFVHAEQSFLATSFGAARFYADDPVRSVAVATTPEGGTVVVVGTEQGTVHFTSVELAVARSTLAAETI